MGRKLILGTVMTVALLGLTLGAQKAQADAVIATGDIRLGINDQGHLNVFAPGVAINSSFVGLTYLPTGDATSPGCLCEGWGVAATDSGATIHSGGIGEVTGIDNISLDSFVSGPSTATSVTHLTSLPGLTITQAYQPSAAPGALFENIVTITNSTGATVTDVRYTRAMDWDVPPEEFSEYVTIGGLPASAVLFTSDDGFASPNPYDGRSDLDGCGTTTNFADCGRADHGAIFDFGFGDLAAGESQIFSIFYGAAGSEADAFAALGAVGAEVYSLGQSSLGGTPATYIFAFKGVGGVAVPPSVVPEPTSMALLGSGLLGLLRARRKS